MVWTPYRSSNCCGAAAAALVDVVENPAVILKQRFAEGPAVDEDALLRPETPDQVAAIFVGVEYGPGDVVRQQKIGRAGGIAPFGRAQLKGASPGCRHASADQHQRRGKRQQRRERTLPQAVPGKIRDDDDGRDQSDQNGISLGAERGRGEGGEQDPVDQANASPRPQHQQRGAEPQDGELAEGERNGASPFEQVLRLAARAVIQQHLQNADSRWDLRPRAAAKGRRPDQRRRALPRRPHRFRAHTHASTTHPRKKPPWQLAQTRKSGGSSQSQRRYSRIAMVAASNRNVIR